MTTKMAAEKRKQMLRDGVCVIEDVAPEAFLQELRNETERMIATHEEPADLVYQGQHIGVKREDNPVIEKLLSWEPSYQALSDLGFGDFQTRTGVIILTKEPNGPPVLASGLDAMERSNQSVALAGDHFSELLHYGYIC